MSIFLDTFVLVFGSLLPIVNPLGTAFLFLALTRSADRRTRSYLASRIAVYGLIIIVLSLLGGSWLLTFFGVSVPALRVGGGMVLIVVAWRLLNREDEPQQQAPEPADVDTLRSSAFYPLTMPLTTGPGTIAATIALGTSPSVGPLGSGEAMLGALAAAAAISALIYVFYSVADRMESLFGQTLTDALMRLFALLLLCIGVEIFWAGLVALIQEAHLLTAA